MASGSPETTQTTPKRDPDVQEFFKEQSPSSRFEEDLSNYKPGLIVTDPRHVEYFDFDKTPSLQRLEMMSEPRSGANIADSFESYVSKSFAPAYTRLEDDPMFRKIRSDTTAQENQKYKSRYSKGGNFLDEKSSLYDVDDTLSADSLADLYRECKMEREKISEFEVYQPKGLQYVDSRSPVSIRDVARTDRDWSPIDIEGNVRDFKSGIAETASGQRNMFEERTHRQPSARHVIIDTSKYGYRKNAAEDALPYYPARTGCLRKDDSIHVGGNFVMLTLRRDDRWNDKVDKLLKEARST